MKLANMVFSHISFSIRNKVGEAHKVVIFLFIVIMRKYGKAISCLWKRQSQNVLSSCFPNLVLLHTSFKAYDSPQSGAISCFRKLLCFNCRTYFQSFLILVKEYHKVTSSRLSRLVAHLWIFRLFMKGKFDAYVLRPLAKIIQN